MDHRWLMPKRKRIGNRAARGPNAPRDHRRARVETPAAVTPGRAPGTEPARDLAPAAPARECGARLGSPGPGRRSGDPVHHRSPPPWGDHSMARRNECWRPASGLTIGCCVCRERTLPEERLPRCPSRIRSSQAERLSAASTIRPARGSSPEGVPRRGRSACRKRSGIGLAGAGRLTRRRPFPDGVVPLAGNDRESGSLGRTLTRRRTACLSRATGARGTRAGRAS